jgi:hypothetical protein
LERKLPEFKKYLKQSFKMRKSEYPRILSRQTLLPNNPLHKQTFSVEFHPTPPNGNHVNIKAFSISVICFVAIRIVIEFRDSSNPRTKFFPQIIFHRNTLNNKQAIFS